MPLVDRDLPYVRDLVGHLPDAVALREDDLQLDVGCGRGGRGDKERERTGEQEAHAATVAVLPPVYARPVTEIELCWRCGAAMLWVQSTWQCPRCKWKLGCCEGEPQSACRAEQQLVMTHHKR